MTPNGTALRALRQVQSMSLRDLARLADTTASQISRIERGEIGEPGEELLRRLADALSVSVDDITRGEPVPPTKTKDERAKTQPEREVPYPGTPEGEVFHYTPDEAARFLPWSALQLRRKAYAREIPFNDGGKRVTFTGRNIREISDMTEVRPLAETTQRRSA
ncbi:helix-turn-helix transcriptional regulator [Streptomyces sp. NPDC006355]|uniref:helix-turn-helix domain-containing protein n=1 Tax=Streptomyces sp. NPDC006355 TaxID=3156758 RepID=UPI0033A2B2D6